MRGPGAVRPDPDASLVAEVVARDVTAAVPVVRTERHTVAPPLPARHHAVTVRVHAREAAQVRARAVRAVAVAVGVGVVVPLGLVLVDVDPPVLAVLVTNLGRVSLGVTRRHAHEGQAGRDAEREAWKIHEGVLPGAE